MKAGHGAKHGVGQVRTELLVVQFRRQTSILQSVDHSLLETMVVGQKGIVQGKFLGTGANTDHYTKGELTTSRSTHHCRFDRHPLEGPLHIDG